MQIYQCCWFLLPSTESFIEYHGKPLSELSIIFNTNDTINVLPMYTILQKVDFEIITIKIIKFY